MFRPVPEAMRAPIFLTILLLADPASGRAEETETSTVEAPGILERLRLPSIPNLQTFTATDGSAGGLHTSIGFKRAFAPTLDEDAWLLVGIAGSGISPAGKEVKDVRDTASTLPSLRARLLLGRQTSFGGLYLAGFAGPEMEAKAADPDSPKMNRSYGIRFEGQAYWRPTDTVTASMVLTAGSAVMDARLRMRAGRRIVGPVTAGPELVFSASDGHRESRIGLHVSDITFFRWTFEVSAGTMRDTDGRSGWYGTLVNLRRF